MKSKLIFEKTMDLSGNEKLDVYLREVKKDRYFPEGVKYAINYRVKEGKCWNVVLRLDNKEQRGHHVHYNGKITPFDFVSFEAAINYVMKMREALYENRSKGSRNRD
jgi:hypothetical protein